jgi:ribonucleotide monophosphatase NagD (HAD superfamily)
MDALPPLPDGEFWGVMSSQNSQVETLGVPWRRLEDEKPTYDAASGFLLLSASEWSDTRQLLLRESLAKTPRPILVGNPDIIAPREDHLSLEPGYYAHELRRDLKLKVKLFGKPFANIYDLAFDRLSNVDPSRVAMVGDTLHTDVLGGAAYGFKTVLVTNHGLFAGCDYARYIEQTRIVPDFIIPTI